MEREREKGEMRAEERVVRKRVDRERDEEELERKRKGYDRR